MIAEFKQNLARYDVSFVSVHDDNFTTDPHWVEEFCEAYRKEVNLPWYCFGYPTTIKPRLVKAMKAANCATIFMGVDSGDADIRRYYMERPMPDELIYRSAALIKGAGIGLQVSCIYGNPGETPDVTAIDKRPRAGRLEVDVDGLGLDTQVDRRYHGGPDQALYAYADEDAAWWAVKPTQCSAYIFYPFPKTKLHEMAVKMGYLDEEGQEKVREGISGYHHESILKHPHKEHAETFAKITPVYARAPRLLKPALRWIIARRMKRLALFLYVCLIPLTFPFLGMEGIRVTLRMAWRALRGRRPRAAPPTSGPAEPAADAA